MAQEGFMGAGASKPIARQNSENGQMRDGAIKRVTPKEKKLGRKRGEKVEKPENKTPEDTSKDETKTDATGTTEKTDDGKTPEVKSDAKDFEKMKYNDLKAEALKQGYTGKKLDAESLKAFLKTKLTS